MTSLAAAPAVDRGPGGVLRRFPTRAKRGSEMRPNAFKTTPNKRFRRPSTPPSAYPTNRPATRDDMRERRERVVRLAQTLRVPRSLSNPGSETSTPQPYERGFLPSLPSSTTPSDGSKKSSPSASAVSAEPLPDVSIVNSAVRRRSPGGLSAADAGEGALTPDGDLAQKGRGRRGRGRVRKGPQRGSASLEAGLVLAAGDSSDASSTDVFADDTGQNSEEETASPGDGAESGVEETEQPVTSAKSLSATDPPESAALRDISDAVIPVDEIGGSEDASEVIDADAGQAIETEEQLALEDGSTSEKDDAAGDQVQNEVGVIAADASAEAETQDEGEVGTSEEADAAEGSNEAPDDETAAAVGDETAAADDDPAAAVEDETEEAEGEAAAVEAEGEAAEAAADGEAAEPAAEGEAAEAAADGEAAEAAAEGEAAEAAAEGEAVEAAAEGEAGEAAAEGEAAEAAAEGEAAEAAAEGEAAEAAAEGEAAEAAAEDEAAEAAAEDETAEAAAEGEAAEAEATGDGEAAEGEATGAAEAEAAAAETEGEAAAAGDEANLASEANEATDAAGPPDEPGGDGGDAEVSEVQPDDPAAAQDEPNEGDAADANKENQEEKGDYDILIINPDGECSDDNPEQTGEQDGEERGQDNEEENPDVEDKGMQSEGGGAPTQEEGAEPEGSSAAEPPSEEALAPYEEMVQVIRSGGEEEQFAAVKRTRKLLSKNDGTPIDEFLKAGILPPLKACLEKHHNPQLQFEALWALTNIASGTSEQTKAVVDADFVPIFLRLLSSNSSKVREQAVWVVGNILGDSPELRDRVVEEQAIPRLYDLYLRDSKEKSLENLCWTFTNIFRHNPWQLEDGELAMCRKAITGFFYGDNKRDVQDALWTMAFMTDAGADHVNWVVDSGFVPRLEDVLQSGDPNHIKPALHVITNLLRDPNHRKSVALRSNVVLSVVRLSTSSLTAIRKDAAKALDIIVNSGDQELLNAALEADLPTGLALMMQRNDPMVKGVVGAAAVAVARDTPVERLPAVAADKPYIMALNLLLNQESQTLIMNGLEALLTAIQRCSELGYSISSLERLLATERMLELARHQDPSIKTLARAAVSYYSDKRASKQALHQQEQVAQASE